MTRYERRAVRAGGNRAHQHVNEVLELPRARAPAAGPPPGKPQNSTSDGTSAAAPRSPVDQPADERRRQRSHARQDQQTEAHLGPVPAGLDRETRADELSPRTRTRTPPGPSKIPNGTDRDDRSRMRGPGATSRRCSHGPRRRHASALPERRELRRDDLLRSRRPRRAEPSARVNRFMPAITRSAVSRDRSAGGHGGSARQSAPFRRRERRGAPPRSHVRVALERLPEASSRSYADGEPLRRPPGRGCAAARRFRGERAERRVIEAARRTIAAPDVQRHRAHAAAAPGLHFGAHAADRPRSRRSLPSSSARAALMPEVDAAFSAPGHWRDTDAVALEVVAGIDPAAA